MPGSFVRIGLSVVGFSVHNGKPVRRQDAAGLERVAQYTRLQRLWLRPGRRHCGQVIRNPFSEQKMTYNEENGTVIYRSRMHANCRITGDLCLQTSNKPAIASVFTP